MRRGALILAALVPMTLMPMARAQQAALSVPGPWGEMREESPARPLDDAGDAAIRLRQQHMRAISSQYRTIETLVMAGTPVAPLAEAAASTLLDLARRNAALFEPAVARRTRFGAKAAIWQEPAEFAEHVAGFTEATARLVRAIGAGDAGRVPAELAAVRHQCLACHHHYADWENRPGIEGRRAAPRP